MEKNQKEKKYPWNLETGDVDQYHGTILERIHIFKGQHRFYATAYQKGDDKSIIVNKSGPIPNSGKYYNQSLTLSKQKHMRGFVRALDRLSEKVGWPSGKHANDLEDLLFELQETKNETEKSKELSGRRLKVNQELKDQIIKYRSQIDQVLELYWSTNLPNFRKSLSEFKKLVQKKKPERKYQEFLEKQENLWILGLEYVSVNRHAQAGTIGIPDFVPKRFDGFHDVIEFKKPSEDVFIWKESRWRQSTKVKDGLSQLMDYLELFDRKPAGGDEITANQDKYRPNGFLVIGNLKGKEREAELRYALRRHNSFLQRIKIITYDGLIEQSSTILTNLEQKLKESKKVTKPKTP